ncbi:endonuclease/exonuclease/phosphatase family protein [Sneathiella sp. HT1-7]|uniref:endonuclease/exonuclease/phosphatase family protein n=1 Tax=Sneathiella sp. HT1-7 TaxID=2887192 RepID=UPI001D157748|nr:endonuclease/exonuclease/phosphatase family protein [Sneathiella sp. HT1-7]MCC3306413.1 endonuclease/exonuclease/phosphatase family protein [Sneathiella sp. HT1-7]
MSYYVLGTVASFSFLASLIPFIPIAHGAVRVFDFGRLQLALLSITTTIFVLAILPINWISLIFLAMLVAALAIQTIYIIRFTPLWAQQSAKHSTDSKGEDVISLFVCNVKQGNRRYQDLIKLINTRDPDILILMETDQQWVDALDASLTEYAQKISCPQDNSYGMYLTSRLEMPSGEIKYLLNEGIPSFHCSFKVTDGHLFDLISIHPDPPVPHRDTQGRDAEILVAGKLAAKRQRPLIVTGDLNDVAWSETTRRFLRISQLLDPRQGRGMFNSFDARFPFLRWPLDHVFHSEEFELVSIERQPHIGSDHFPMFYEFALVFKNDNSLPDDATADDREEAERLIDTEKNRSRKPVGEDWEG